MKEYYCIEEVCRVCCASGSGAGYIGQIRLKNPVFSSHSAKRLAPSGAVGPGRCSLSQAAVEEMLRRLWPAVAAPELRVSVPWALVVRFKFS